MKEKSKVGFGDKILRGIEKVGNKLPDPVTLFFGLAILVLVLSALLSSLGVSAVNPATGEELHIVNLLSREGFQRIWSNAVSNFSGFAPFGVVMVAVIGSGAAEKSGFLAALMHKLMAKASPAMVTFVIIFVGINANLAGDAGFVLMPPLAAVIFLSMGRHPLHGMLTAFAAVAAGFAANLTVGLPDALAYGFTEAAARMIDAEWAATPAMNWYFLIVSCILLSIVGTFVSEKLVAPRFANTDLSKYSEHSMKNDLTPEQERGVKWGCIAFAIAALIIVALCIGPKPLMGDPETGSLLVSTSPFMSGIIFTVSILLFVPGAVYGFVSGKYKNDKDLFADVGLAFKDMSSYILLCFFCAQFTSYFSWSNIGAIMAIKGAGLLTAMNLRGIPLLIGLIFISCIVNIFIGSASAKWAILAPIFVPMMMLMGLDPAVTQVAYRIGDSLTNPLSPLFSYFPLILGFARKYEKDTGMGTVIANMVPFSACFAITWIALLIVWVLTGLPLGPGGGIFL